MAAGSLEKDASAALERATKFFESISTRGGYLWWYSEDLKQRAGENKATETQIWVQPPGTPSVGMAFLRAYEATKNKRCLAAAKNAAEALAWGQLESGGWTYQIDFDPENQRTFRRADKGQISDKEILKRRNVTTFDDDTTQSALRFLMAVVDASAGNDGVQEERIKSALEYGLEALLKAQYPNGAWPQGYDGKLRHPADYPIKPAQVPTRWSRTPDVKAYWSFYTFNDHAIRNCILTLLEAHRRFGKPEYLEAVKRGGDFILLAQLPSPQAGWAQQYNFDMEPSWARRFEPPAVSAGESSGILRTLVDLHLATGDEKYLKPVPAASGWLKRSQIASNKWARFYELGSNKPLYFTKDYRLVYTDDDLPTHYSFQSDYNIPGALAYCEDVRQAGRDAWLRQHKPVWMAGPPSRKSRKALEPRVWEIITGLDARGRWVVNGRIESRLFIDRVQTLCDYLSAE